MKKIMMAVMIATMTLGMSLVSFAGEWQWIDTDENGVAECYYIDDDGTILTDTVTPDGYTVNELGQWTENGIVKTQDTTISVVTDNGIYTGYTDLGISKAALEMVWNTREENAKYGEVKVDDYDGGVFVYYANGLAVDYPNQGTGFRQEVQAIDVNGTRNENLLFEYYKDGFTSTDDIVSYLIGKGYKKGAGDNACYTNNNTTVSIAANGGCITWNINSGLFLYRNDSYAWKDTTTGGGTYTGDMELYNSFLEEAFNVFQSTY